MFRPELTTDECQDCRVCRACSVAIHSCCFPVYCIATGQRHGCNCPICAHREGR